MALTVSQRSERELALQAAGFPYPPTTESQFYELQRITGLSQTAFQQYLASISGPGPAATINGIPVPVTQVNGPVGQPGDVVPLGVGVGGLAMAPLVLGAIGGGGAALLGGGLGEVLTGVGQGVLAGAPAVSGATPLTGVDGIPISGPGVPEPPRGMVAKQWRIMVRADDIGNFWVYFFRLIDGRIMCYNPRKEEWKIWRPKKMVVLSSDPRMSQIRKLERVYRRVVNRLAKKSKALKLEKGWGGR